MKLIRSNQSDQDIESIADYFAQDNPRAALKWIIEIEEKLESIAAAPGIGRARPDVQNGLRTLRSATIQSATRKQAKMWKFSGSFMGPACGKTSYECLVERRPMPDQNTCP